MKRGPTKSTRTDTRFPYTTLFRSVKSGEVSVSAAEQVAKLEKEAQQELCSRGPKAIRKAAKDMREEGRSKPALRSEEHTSELQSQMRISYAVFCLKKKTEESERAHDTNQDNKYEHIISKPI